MDEVIKIPADLMKEDLGRIAQWISLIKNIEPVAFPSDDDQSSRGFQIAERDPEPLLDYIVVKMAIGSIETLANSMIDANNKRKQPLSSHSEKKNFSELVSGKKSIKDQTIHTGDAIQIFYSLFYTRDLFTIVFNLLPTLARIEKLLTLQTILLAESAHCSGGSHPVASSLQKLREEGLVPWKRNDEALDDGPAVEIYQRLRPHLSAGHPVPPDFSSFAQSYPSWDAFWQIAAWKAHRMETAVEATVRELLIEAWKCPEKSLSGTMPEPDEAIEPEWDWMTETTKPGVPRGGIKPFAYGAGHPVAEFLWDSIWNAEHERRSYTDEIPLTFPKDLYTFRCPVPVDAKAVREVVAHPWRYAAETDLPDFTGLWGGFAKQAEQLFSGKESLSRTAEGKEITWKDLRDGEESIYKRGIGILDHLASVQEYYRPLRAIDPVEWRDTAEMLKEEHMAEMAGRAENLEERMK